MTKKTKIIESELIGPCIAVEPKLYEAYSIIDDFIDEGQVKMHWFCWTRENPIGPYELLIRDYKPKSYSEGFLDECFTEFEIGQLKEYLERVHDLSIHIEKIDLPISNNMISYGAIGTSGIYKITNGGIEYEIIEGNYRLSEVRSYSLPFEVWGYYDLEEIV